MGASTPSFAYFCMSSKLFIMVIPPNIRHSAAIAPIRAPLASRCTYIALHNKSRIFFASQYVWVQAPGPLNDLANLESYLDFCMPWCRLLSQSGQDASADGRVAGGQRPGGLGQRSRRGKLLVELAPRIRNVRQ